MQSNLNFSKFGGIFGRGRRFDKLILKFIWKCKNPRVAQKIWKRNKVYYFLKNK